MSDTPAERDQVRDETTEKLSDQGVGATIGAPDTFEPEESEGVDEPDATSEDASAADAAGTHGAGSDATEKDHRA